MSDNINYSKLLQEVLTENNFTYSTTEKENATILSFGVNLKSGPNISYKMTVNDHGDTKLYSFLCTGVDESKTDRMLELLNELNGYYKYVSFNLDKDNDVCAAYDFGLYGNKEDVLSLAMDAIGIISQIISKSIPRIMKIVWDESTDNTEFINNDEMFSE